ncbi:MAG TPA: tetratricopeptide repeat protein, partial [Gemmatimonadaceae bacterium]
LDLLRPSSAPAKRVGTLVRAAAVLAVILVLAVAGYVLSIYFPFFVGSRIVGQVGAPTAVHSIAVLPFDVIGGEAKDAYFGDGISEELIDALSKLRDLRVAGRTSSFAFRKQVGDARSIGKALGVASILTGSVQRSSNHIRVRAQLTDANTGYTLWSQSFDNDATDVFAVQDKISTAIVSALSVTLGAGEATALHARQTNGKAYEEYLQGVYAWNQRGAGIMRSLSFFRKSIELDSTYAPAYGMLASAYLTAADWSFVPVAEAVKLARANANKAIALDSLSSEGHLMLADLACRHDYEFDAGVQQYQRTLALNPGFSFGHYQFAWCLAGLGRFDEAIAEANKARELDPLNPQMFSSIGKAYYLARKWDEGLAAYDVAATLPGDVASHYYWSSQFYVQHGDTTRALASVRKGVAMSGDSPLYAGGMAVVYAEAGRADSARAIVARLEKLTNRPTYHIAATHALLHEDDAALTWLERAYAERSDWTPTMRYDVAFDRVRQNPRFVALAKKLNTR